MPLPHLQKPYEIESHHRRTSRDITPRSIRLAHAASYIVCWALSRTWLLEFRIQVGTGGTLDQAWLQLAADFDLRWKVALGVGLEERPFAKSTLQLFRARLIIHARMHTVFRKSLDFARHTGYLRSRRLKVVLDTTYVLGRGAVQDTYNLLADGIRKLAAALAANADCGKSEVWAVEHGLGRYFGSSLKGEAGIDWDDPEAWQAFLGGVVADADRLLTVAREAMGALSAGDPERRRLRDAAVLLERLLMQDIERREDGTSLKQGVSPDRVVSVHDPEMRHGRKCAKRRFDGHKAHLAVEPESQLITAADVLAGNAPDHERALELVE